MCSLLRRAPTSTLFPYTTLFRSVSVIREVGCRFWLEGGWGVDALVGRQTRPHRDLDIDVDGAFEDEVLTDRKSTRLNSSHMSISYAVFCLKKKRRRERRRRDLTP